MIIILSYGLSSSSMDYWKYFSVSVGNCKPAMGHASVAVECGSSSSEIINFELLCRESTNIFVD